MAKAYRASITMTIYPDENGMMEWEDAEDGDSRTEEELINYAISELTEVIYDATKYSRVEEIIDVEVVEE